MLVGPVFTRELTAAPRSLRFYLTRAGYVAALFGLSFTAWLILSQKVRGLGDLARFGSEVFTLLAPIQLVIAMAFSALIIAAEVAQEKDRRTLDLLLMTNLTNSELVLGKLFANMLRVFVPIVAAIPLFVALALLGGISYWQIARVVAVTLVAAIAAGSLGSMIALWRERTFQSLALTALVIVFWLLGAEIIRSGVWQGEWLGIGAVDWAAAISPFRAIQQALRPLPPTIPALQWCGGTVNLFLILTSTLALLINLWAIARVRVWNPTQQRESRLQDADEAVDQQLQGVSKKSVQESRNVWDNPILWREICTWAYGKKIIAVRLAYLVIFAICAMGLYQELNSGNIFSYQQMNFIHSAAKPIIPLMLLGFILVNALAVTSLTNERDLRALDLLLVTDLTPKEIIYGKLGGIFFNSKEMILLPLGLCFVLWHYNLLDNENLIFLITATLVMNAFVAMVGVHVGMTYSESRTAVGVSLSTVMFLLLGVGVCMRMMMSFQSFENQLPSFLAFIVGGGTALFMALGRRLPSQAIGWASFIAPFATFYVITSFINHSYGFAFLVTVITYGFATAALLIPAIDEFDVATGRTTDK